MTREEALQAIKEKMDYYENDKRLRGAIETLFPKLKKSEDERIIDALILELKTNPCIARTNGYNRNSYITWLEKQKEQKTAEWDELQADFRNINEAFEDGKKEVINNPEKYGLCRPVEWSEDFEQNISNLLHNKLMWHSDDGNISSAVFIDDKTIKDIVAGIWFYVGKEAMKNPNMELPMQEWSKEDENKMDVIIHLVEQNSGWTDMAIKEYVTWLKSLHLQPKVEWNKIDEEIIYLLYSFLIQAEQSGRYGSIQIAQMEQCINWLKSLHPHPYTVSIKNANKFAELEYEHGVKDGIQHVKNHQWKPSEEQMGALNYAYCELFKREDVEHNILGPLQKLIDQLKKL